MPIETIAYIAFWGTCTVVATLAGLDIVRTLLVAGLSKIEKRLTNKINNEPSPFDRIAEK